jgi:hypothetical protein
MGTPVSETNNKSLTIVHSNIRSLRNKINYISDIIEDFDMVFFTETHLDYLISNVNIKCEGFETPIKDLLLVSETGVPIGPGFFSQHPPLETIIIKTSA